MKLFFRRPEVLFSFALFISFGMFIAGLFIGQSRGVVMASQGDQITQTKDINLEPFWEAMRVLDNRFVSTTPTSVAPKNEDKVWGAIEGMTASYGDPYTVFFPPKETKAFADEVRGNFEGIGMEVGIKDKILTVVAPLKGTPAERAGLKPGDQIIRIDKVFTGGMSIENAIHKIRGPKGTVVVLTIRGNSDKNNGTKDISVTRAVITIPTIDTKLRDDGIFVISLYNFSAQSADLFRDAVKKFSGSGSKKLILDLRGNPGGYLDAAIDMASLFLPMGKVIVIEDKGGGANPKLERSKGFNLFKDSNLKMVVLINQGSASASEILAGALRDHGVATLVGEKSFGKGSVQEVINITPETSLKVTIARWLTPNGKSISLDGINPDIEVKFEKKDFEKKRDPQMDKAALILKDKNYKNPKPSVSL